MNISDLTKKISSFHTHTSLCNHAQGTVTDYYSVAVSEGCSALGFSDHCPYPNDGVDTWPEIRMTPFQADKYVLDVRSIAQRSSFPIYCGFECEYDKRYKNWYKDLKDKYFLDYLVLGSHWVELDGEFVYAPNINGIKNIHKYFDNFIEAIKTGLFNFVAHPDLIMADGREWNKELKDCFSYLIDAAKDSNLPLEVNGEGLFKPTVKCNKGFRYQYPVEEFWIMVKEKNASVICNSDAHLPENVLQNARFARDFSRKIGLNPIENIF